MNIRGKPTSLDIAHLAGVSQPTVSRALRGSPSVNEATRRRILAIAEQLNYKVDKNASNLRAQQSGTLALLFFEDPAPDESMINPFFHSMLGSITRACARHGYDLLVSFQQFSLDWHADFEDSHKADGLILLGYGDYLQARSRLEELVAHGTHFVRWGAVLPGQPGVSIGCDNFQGGQDMRRHQLARGYRRIAFLGDATDHYPEFRERHRGLVQALAEAGLAADPALVQHAISSEEAGHAAAGRLLEGGAEFDAVFAASDMIAIGALRALGERGLRVPHDVGLAGYDDIPMAAMTSPGLTTMQQDTKTAGTLLVETLIAMIRGEPARTRCLPVRLVVRESA